MKLDITQAPSITLYDYVTTHGIATGSRVLGGYTEKSDYDYVITEQELKTIRPMFPDLINTPREYKQSNLLITASVKFTHLSKTIDIIIVKNEKIKEAWNQATISYTKSIQPMNDKALRIKLFECLVNFHTVKESPF